MIDVCAEHFYWDFQHILNKNVKSSNFEEILDTNVLLIGLQNGVYDLSSHMFRSAKPDDFIFLTTKNSYCEFSWTHVVVLEILDFFRKVFPNQTIRNYVLKLFASFMDGNIEEQFYIFTASNKLSFVFLLENKHLVFLIHLNLNLISLLFLFQE